MEGTLLFACCGSEMKEQSKSASSRDGEAK